LPDQVPGVLRTSLVWPDPLSLVCAKDHPLANQVTKGPISASQLVAHNAVLPARGTVTRDILLTALKPYGVTVETSLETNYLETIKMMVSVGLGWSALPIAMLDEDIVQVPVKGLSMQRQLGYVHLDGKTLSRAALAFLEMLP